MINNPVIRGFNPDPSIIRIEDTYYIATSTFEWYPGVNIYKSKDLIDGELHSRPLNKKSLLDLTGVPDGGGIWAPCLSYDGKKVYLVYTVVKERGLMMQTDNYLIETDDIGGEWSDRIYLNSIGFDPSLFHDDDGKKYLISLENHYEKNKRFNGLYIEAYDDEKKCLMGGRQILYSEPSGELVEGTHIIKKDDYYYLLKAQGGTGVRHSAQMARSKSLFGEWEEDNKILIHARDNESLPLQKAGHADMVDTPEGDFYLVYLASRGLYSVCGRETCIEKVSWRDGWLRLDSGKNTPKVEICDGMRAKEDKCYAFADNSFWKDFQSLRDNIEEKVRLKDGLLLKGGSGLSSYFDQSLIARRICEENVEVLTRVDFSAESERHMAGLVFIYDTKHWYYLYITKKGKRRIAKVLGCVGGKAVYYDSEIELEDGEVLLSAKLKDKKITFFVNGEMIQKNLDAKILTDEYVPLGFTGAMVGVNCIDCEKQTKWARFKSFEYKEL